MSSLVREVWMSGNLGLWQQWCLENYVCNSNSKTYLPTLCDIFSYALIFHFLTDYCLFEIHFNLQNPTFPVHMLNLNEMPIGEKPEDDAIILQIIHICKNLRLQFFISKWKTRQIDKHFILIKGVFNMRQWKLGQRLIRFNADLLTSVSFMCCATKWQHKINIRFYYFL